MAVGVSDAENVLAGALAFRVPPNDLHWFTYQRWRKVSVTLGPRFPEAMISNHRPPLGGPTFRGGESGIRTRDSEGYSLFRGSSSVQ